MKKAVMCLIIFLALLWACPAFACTGFAMYGDAPVYGMNFDYPPTEVRFVIEENRDTRYLMMQFLQEGSFQTTAGMNDRGLFATLQMQLPELEGQSGRGRGELFVPELIDCIKEYGSLDEVLDFVGDRRLLQWRGITLHSLIADAGGHAVIAEAGDEQNELLPIEDDFIVMTNFKNSVFKDQSYSQVRGAGADRYIAAYEYIRDNRDGFGIDQGFEVLKRTVQRGSYPTLSSMVFMPEEQSVYIVLRRDFGRVWKISIPDRTIETYRGFEEQMKYRIPRKGVLASDLISGAMDGYEPYEAAAGTDTAGRPMRSWYSSPIAIVLALAVVLAAGILVLRKRRAHR